MRKHNITAIFLSLLTFGVINIAIAQNEEKAVQHNLNTQYETLIENSETFNEYKVIKKTKLDEFQKVVKDSLSMINNSKKEAFNKLKTQQAQVKELTAQVSAKDAEKAELQESISSINVLGINMDKTSYVIVSLIIPAVLLIVIVLLIGKMKHNNRTTKEAQQHLASIESEYEEHKKRALETQMKLKRELQTERNKLMETAR